MLTHSIEGDESGWLSGWVMWKWIYENEGVGVGTI